MPSWLPAVNLWHQKHRRTVREQRKGTQNLRITTAIWRKFYFPYTFMEALTLWSLFGAFGHWFSKWHWRLIKVPGFRTS